MNKDFSHLDFSKQNGLIPAIIQHVRTARVLMLAYMNREALDVTISSGKATFFSRSRNRLWTKGEESGNFLYVKEILSDCDNDTLLVLVEPAGPVCHTGALTCFGNESHDEISFLAELQDLILKRKSEMPENSYTTKLFQAGINKIAQKVGEEAVELVIEAKDNDADLFLGEAADLMYHYLVLLAAKGYSIGDVISVLMQRHYPSNK